MKKLNVKSKPDRFKLGQDLTEKIQKKSDEEIAEIILKRWEQALAEKGYSKEEIAEAVKYFW